MEEMNKSLAPADQRLVADYYNALKKTYGKRISEEGQERIHRAFVFACDAHAGVRRKSGEPYIIHPIAVATIASGEIGLGATSIVASLLHDVIEDTDYSYTDIEQMFGEEVAKIVDGLTKLSNEFEAQHDSKQAVNFKKMLLTLSDDVRVILIKLADRLHNMRTLDSMIAVKQLKIASETQYLFAPLAHRLGLYAIKTELEDLSLKYIEPETYQYIQLRLHDQKEQRDYLIEQFITPVEEALKQEGYDFKITGRLKSVYSIWNKMQKKGVMFDEIYDLLAIRIVFKPSEDCSEKKQCFNILSTLTDIYNPKPGRIRDWVAIPKANGYEALHVTVMGPQGRWVEVQIRSERMNEIAERGFAAHYKYKDDPDAEESELDRWLLRIREVLDNANSDAVEFVNEFKMNLFSNEIVAFTPQGKMVFLPKDASVIDFAYEIHTDLGNQCIGAKVNHMLVPCSYLLKSGDQVEVLSSKNQKPEVEWLNFIKTSKAKNKIKTAIRSEQNGLKVEGRKIVQESLKRLKLPVNNNSFKELIEYYNLNNKDQLFEQAGMGAINFDDIEKVLNPSRPNVVSKYWSMAFGRKNKASAKEANKTIDKKETFIIKEHENENSYSFAKCCHPIPGDNIVGYLNSHSHVSIHKRNCEKASQLMAQQGDRIMNVQWTEFKKKEYSSYLKLEGFDRLGILNEITNIISKLNNINMSAANFQTNDGIFVGELHLKVHSLNDLNKLIAKLSKLKGIERIDRVSNKK